MVDTHSITPTAASVIQTTVNSLHQLGERTLTSQQFIAMAEALYWSLLEGEYRTDDSCQSNQLREVLADITAQWESLLGNQHETNGTLGIFPEFPPEWVQLWSEQIQHLECYYKSTQFLVDCLNSDCYVSREVRQQIEETLLLPIAEIEKRRKD